MRIYINTSGGRDNFFDENFGHEITFYCKENEINLTLSTAELLRLHYIVLILLTNNREAMEDPKNWHVYTDAKRNEKLYEIAAQKLIQAYNDDPQQILDFKKIIKQ